MSDEQSAVQRAPGALTGACAFAVIAVALVLLRSLVVLPWVENVHAWVVPIDVWTPVRAARSVANGDVFHLYEPLAGRTGYPYTPAFPVLLAPFVRIGDHFNLLGDFQFPRRYPGMFLVLGPADVVLGTLPVLFAVGRAVDGSRRRRISVQGVVFLTVAWTSIGFFHPEDAIVTATLLASCLAIGRGSWRAAGAWAGAALLFKQWAAWPALVCVVLAPRSKRVTVAFYAYAVPALMMVPFVLASHETWTSLTGAMVTLSLGQRQLWTSFMFGHGALGSATVLRGLWGVAALAIAMRVRRRPSCDAAMAAMCVIMLVRLVIEPELFGYYLVPATTLALVWCARNDEQLGLRALTSFLLCAFCIPHTFPDPVFFVMLWAGLAYVCGPTVRAWWSGAEESRVNRTVIDTAAIGAT